MLRASKRQAIGFAPTGGFHLIDRRGVGFRPVLAGFRYPPGSPTAVTDTLWLSPRNNINGVRLSATRGLRYKKASLKGQQASLNPEYLQGALVDAQGRALTKYLYARIEPFQASFALARRTGTGGFVLLNRQGQEVIPPCSYLSPLHRNRALVGYPIRTPAGWSGRGRVDLVDSTGQVIRAFPDGQDGEWLIEGELFRIGLLRGPAPLHLYDRNGQEVLAGQGLASVGKFWNNRLWVRTLDGHEGLVDRQLRWVVPANYHALYYLHSDGSRAHYLDPLGDRGRFFHDSAYMVVKHAGQYGQVAIGSGRLAVPIQYDTLLSPLTHGFATGQRTGVSYVVNSQGQELTRGKAEWLYATCREGSCWVPVVRNQELTLFNDQGRQLCPWYPIAPTGSGGGNCPLPFQLPHPGYDGLTVRYDCRRNEGKGQANLVNQAGQTQLPWRYHAIQAWANFYAMRFSTPSGSPQWVLYNRRLQPVLSQPVADLHERPGNWITSGKELFQADGRRIAVPSPDKQWFVEAVPLLPDEPFARGVWRVEWYDRAKQFEKFAGYLTIGKKQLWED